MIQMETGKHHQNETSLFQDQKFIPDKTQMETKFSNVSSQFKMVLNNQRTNVHTYGRFPHSICLGPIGSGDA